MNKQDSTADAPEVKTQSKPTAPPVPFSDALVEVVKGLKDKPVPLFTLGAAIILLGAGVWGPDSLRALIVPLLVVVLAGLIAWVFLETRNVQKGPATGSGKISEGFLTRVSNTTASTG